MGMSVKKPEDTGSKYDPIPEGLHHAVCYRYYDLGTHHQERWDKDVRKVLIGWELPDERIQIERDGEQLDLPRAISKKYTLSLHEKAKLHQHMVSWRGRSFTDEELAGFDLDQILGENCQLQIIHQQSRDGQRTFAVINNVLPLSKGMQKQEPENEIDSFYFDSGREIPDNTPDWIADQIKESYEGKERWGIDDPEPDPTADLQLDDDDIPF